MLPNDAILSPEDLKRLQNVYDRYVDVPNIDPVELATTLIGLFQNGAASETDLVSGIEARLAGTQLHTPGAGGSFS